MYCDAEELSIELGLWMFWRDYLCFEIETCSDVSILLTCWWLVVLKKCDGGHDQLCINLSNTLVLIGYRFCKDLVFYRQIKKFSYELSGMNRLSSREYLIIPFEMSIDPYRL